MIMSVAATPMPRPTLDISRVTPHSHAARESATMAASSTTTPLGPASCANTHVSQAAAPYIGKARNCFSRNIQVPGLGRNDSARGQRPRIKNGSAKPMPRLKKISIAEAVLCVRANPSAAAMNGAVQGAATATARTPVKNAPSGPERAARLSPMVIEPTSNTPERLRPTAKINSAKPATATGSCSWKPQPTAAPLCRRTTINSPSTRKLRIAPAE